MTAKSDALNAFETALEIAQSNEDSANEHLAEGLIALTKMVAKLQREIDTMASKIR